jgi:hypothetical protein
MGQARITMSDPADAGLLGLSSDELKVIAAPVLGAQSTADLDPQTLAFLAVKLREAGFVAKANDLAMERVNRQKWESPVLTDRLKWLLGWPVGWGYQTEWAFIYATFFVFIGAWVSAYYRDYPDLSPPELNWLRGVMVLRAEVPDRKKLEAAGIRTAETIVTAIIPLLAIFWFPQLFSVTQAQLLSIVGILILILVSYHLGIVRFFRLPTWKQRFIRFLAATRNLGYHSFFFSLDRLLPSPSFHSYWGNYPRIGQSGRNYYYLHRLIGLFLVSITAAGAAGLFE